MATEIINANRPLTEDESKLIRWMLEHGKPEARRLLDQLDRAQVTPGACPCGCASIDLSIDGQVPPKGGLTPIADFVFTRDAEEYGAFVFEIDGMLAGLEVFGLSGDAPKFLPESFELKPWTW